MSSWHSPQSIFNMGHKAVDELLAGPCFVTEKVDGSYIAFGVINGELMMRSKGAVMSPEYPEKMFAKGAETIKRLHQEGKLTPEWTYRGEYLQKPQHNALSYNRTPVGNIILFDICTAEETYLAWDEVEREAQRIGLEVVPFLGWVNHVTPLNVDRIHQLLQATSILGGQKIEGIVVKPCTPIYGPDKKLLMAKFVSEAFKEVHKKAWGESNPTSKDVITLVADQYRTPARWNKAIIHLKEQGLIQSQPQDIPIILKAVVEDVLKEEMENIKNDLFKWGWDPIRRNITRGLPEYYKEQLMREQLSKDEVVSEA